MTTSDYNKIPYDGIDVTYLVGSSMSAADKDALRRYQDAFNLAVYWPDPENFRTCVKAWDALLEAAKGGAQ